MIELYKIKTNFAPQKIIKKIKLNSHRSFIKIQVDEFKI